MRHVAFSLIQRVNPSKNRWEDKKINEMNDLEYRSKANRLMRDPLGRQKIRIGLQVDMGVILAVNAISLWAQKVVLG
jgi:hypothetical protein